LVEVAPMVNGEMIPLQRQSGNQFALGNGLRKLRLMLSGKAGREVSAPDDNLYSFIEQ
jgi:hypothetical protein